jgi:transcriptional regulator with XRE-family HTH domain
MFRLPIIPQLELADLLNISQRAYSKIESGETEIKLKRLQKIATFLNVTISELLTDNTEKTSPIPINNKERTIYESRILHQEKEIEFLKGLVNVFKG